ncbi:ATP-dependent RNA helicase DDX24-like [Sycon ciliatum]|uniref:ATP-dependent RNA helicase DDX24-like n=1 Tax=Sycon ciliatum TaxID=27933 RepID=UPI0031F63004
MPKRKRRHAGAPVAQQLPPVEAGIAFRLEETNRPAKRMKKTDERESSLVWTNLGVPESIVKSLLELGYHTPTTIQREVLPKAIEGRCDVLGVSETGSGKTLAYGLPVLRHILTDLERKLAEEDESDLDEAEQDEGSELEKDSDNLEDVEEDVDEVEGDSEDLSGEDIDTLDMDEFEEQEEDGAGKVCDLTAAVEALEAVKAEEMKLPAAAGHGVHTLVLTPTRELAMQVLGHLQAASKYTDIVSVALVGGLSAQKQKRLLQQRRPHLIVATPGRLWALLNSSESDHLSTMRKTLRCLVIDEADRMVEQGHFAEVELIMSALPKSVAVRGSEKPKLRQSLVFSATLTLPKNAKVSANETLEKLASKACVRSKPKIVDVTGCNKKVETLTEARLMCGSNESKDLYLYHFLTEYPGRTIIFCNSIDCVHRLCGLLTLLRVQPLRLHAGMQQRQRLKTLDRFTSAKSAVMVASDVAARGLDIKNVHHIIHYQVPRHPETYVHRSGRTARANREGLSVVLVSPEDLSLYRRIIKELNDGKELTEFPMRLVDLTNPRRRVTAARLLDKEQHKQKMSKHSSDWFERQADALDIVLDEDIRGFADAEKDKFSSNAHQKKMKRLQTDLDAAFAR